MSVPPGTINTRPHKESNLISEFGKTHLDIECPFCGTKVTAYLWSLAGSGKKCPTCGALHGHAGLSLAPKKEKR